MKVLFVLGLPNPFPGSAWIRISSFANTWSKKHHSIEILGAFSYKSFQKRGAKIQENAKIFNFIFNMILIQPVVFILNNIISFAVSAFFIILKKPNVVIVSVPGGDADFGVLLACKLVGAKYVVDYRDEWEDYTISRTKSRIGKFFYSAVKKLMATLYAKGHLVAAVTPNLMISLKLRGVTNVRLVPNGADTKTFKPLSRRKKNDCFKVFYLGVIGGYYRLDVAVKSIKKLVDKGLNNIKLVIVGEGGEVQKVVNLAHEMSISSNVEYKEGMDDRGKLAKLIAESDVGLVPYDDNPLWNNSLPAKFFEYCACGIPVIAAVHETSLLATFIRKYEIGVTSPPTNEEKLAEAIYWIYKNESFRKAASKRARTLIEEKFDRNKIAEEFLKLLERLT